MTNYTELPHDLLAIVFVMGEGRVAGVMSLLLPIFRLLATRARKKGIDQELIRAYCQ